MEEQGTKCLCSENLTFENKEKELARIVNSKIVLEETTTGIIILCHLENSTVGVNSIPYDVKRGINKLCYCAARKLAFRSDLILTSYLKCRLIKVPCTIKDTEAFTLIGHGHEHSCEYSKVPKLIETSYFSLFLAGANNRKIKELFEDGSIPQEIYKKRPKIYCYRAFCDIGDLVHMPSRSFLLAYIIACENPLDHLYALFD